MRQIAWYVHPYDDSTGVGMITAVSDATTSGISEEVIADVYELAEGRAEVHPTYTVFAPEISAPFPGFPSMVSGPYVLEKAYNFTFIEGNTGDALAIMEKGCGLLVSGMVANRHGAGVGDVVVIEGLYGPVECTVAGIGQGGMAPMSTISMAAKDEFTTATPSQLTLYPLQGTDHFSFEAELRALAEKHAGKMWVTVPLEGLESIIETSDELELMTYSLLVLAILAAALGMVNTVMMSVSERRRELGLLRVVGATRRQVIRVVLGEAALMGLAGGLLGLMAGLGVTVIYAVSVGGIAYGFPDLNLWGAAWDSVKPTLVSGLSALVLTPLISAGAGWLAVRKLIRGTAVEIMGDGNE
jgi:putative ABC transport system permease protein